MTDPKRLYDEDFVLWSQHQAEALRAAARGGANQPLDWEHLAEEIEDLGRSNRRELRSRIRRIIHHLVKLQSSPAHEPRAGWKTSIRDARREIQDLLEDSPNLAREIPQIITQQKARAVRDAIEALKDYGELAGSDPASGKPDADEDRFRLTQDQVLGDWFPAEPRRRGGTA